MFPVQCREPYQRCLAQGSIPDHQIVDGNILKIHHKYVLYNFKCICKREIALHLQILTFALMIKLSGAMLLVVLLACQNNQDVLNHISLNRNLIRERQEEDSLLYSASLRNPVPYGEVFNRRVALKSEIDSLMKQNDSLQTILKK